MMVVGGYDGIRESINRDIEGLEDYRPCKLSRCTVETQIPTETQIPINRRRPEDLPDLELSDTQHPVLVS